MTKGITTVEEICRVLPQSVLRRQSFASKRLNLHSHNSMTAIAS